MRLLAVTRLSDKKDETNSPRRQLKSVHKYAEDNGHIIIDNAEDVESVSGDIAPWDRPNLGPWLRERRDDFDGIIVDRPNRLGRNTLHFLLLQNDFKDKVLISVKPHFDFSTPEGRKAARDYISTAEFEREETAEQVKRSVKELRDMGSYWGGPIPYGLRTVRVSKEFGGVHYAIDEDARPVIEKMADLFLARESLRGISRHLNELGIPSPHGKQWCPESVRIILRSPAITGLQVDRGEIYRDDDGDEVRICDPIILFDRWQAIRDLMAANSHSGPRGANAHMLLHVAYCGKCGAPQYGLSQVTRGHPYRYLKCARKIKDSIPGNCANPVARAELIEQAVSDVIMRELGDVQREEKITHRARDYAAEIAQADHSIDELERQMLAGNLSAERFATMVTRFEERKAEYLAKCEPGSTEWQKKDGTFGEHWESLDIAGKHAFMVANGIRAYVIPKLTVPGMPDIMRMDTDKIPLTTGGFMTLPEGHSVTAVRAGRHHVFVWLGELEPLRKSARQS
jgi:site-specific DNA recombinase